MTQENVSLHQFSSTEGVIFYTGKETVGRLITDVLIFFRLIKLTKHVHHVKKCLWKGAGNCFQRDFSL